MVTVQRNAEAPVFKPSATYSKTIVDTFSVGEPILQVSAEDPVDAIRYRLLSVTDGGIPFFLIEETTGILVLKRPLVNARSQYVVSE